MNLLDGEARILNCFSNLLLKYHSDGTQPKCTRVRTIKIDGEARILRGSSSKDPKYSMRKEMFGAGRNWNHWVSGD